MKTERHRKILELISDNAVTTQEELMAMLSDAGFRVTQATVSRDIKELRLVKVQSSDGRYIYAKPTQDRQTGDMEGFRSIFTQSLLHIDYANNIVVIKCRTRYGKCPYVYPWISCTGKGLLAPSPVMTPSLY